MNMTSNCNVTNSSRQMQVTTICHWMKTNPWKFSAYAADSRSYCSMYKVFAFLWIRLKQNLVLLQLFASQDWRWSGTWCCRSISWDRVRFWRDHPCQLRVTTIAQSLSCRQLPAAKITVLVFIRRSGCEIKLFVREKLWLFAKHQLLVEWKQINYNMQTKMCDRQSWLEIGLSNSKKHLTNDKAITHVLLLWSNFTNFWLAILWLLTSSRNPLNFTSFCKRQCCFRFPCLTYCGCTEQWK